ncbi:hypothetical protein Tco_1146337 [Tanacetum coccineum]
MSLINAEVLSNFISLQCLSSLLNTLLQNTMAEQNVPTQPPTRTDEQIVPRSQWLTIGKSNLLFNAQKIQKNPIFQISVDLLSNTNFFQAFTASANVPLQSTATALAITLVNPLNHFELPPTGKHWIDNCKELGHPEPEEILTNPRHPFSANAVGDSSLNLLVDHAELLWEEVTQGIHDIFPHTKQATKPSEEPIEKVTPLLIP